MAYETIKIDRSSDGVGVLTINRPQAMNALNRQVLSEMESFLIDLKNVPDLRCLIVTGEGEKAFVAGADIKEMENFGPAEALSMAETGHRIFGLLEELPMPVIAAVNGFALGGGLELALACDFIVASHNAKFGLPEVSLGLIPGYGGTQRLSRVVGISTARMMVLTGDIFSAEQAQAWGLVTHLTSQEELLPLAKKLAQSVTARGPVAVATAKKVIQQGFDLPLKEALTLEAKSFSQVFASEDKNEGVKAFIEKRKPKFQGR